MLGKSREFVTHRISRESVGVGGVGVLIICHGASIGTAITPESDSGVHVNTRSRLLNMR